MRNCTAPIVTGLPSVPQHSSTLYCTHLPMVTLVENHMSLTAAGGRHVAVKFIATVVRNILFHYPARKQKGCGCVSRKRLGMSDSKLTSSHETGTSNGTASVHLIQYFNLMDQVK